MKKILGILAVIILIIVAIFVVGAMTGNENENGGSENDQGSEQTAFSETGEVSIDTVGSEEDTVYLVYEDSNDATDRVELIFTSDSLCEEDGEDVDCEVGSFENGDRISVRGTEQDGLVAVETLQVIERVSDDVGSDDDSVDGEDNGNDTTGEMVRVTTPVRNAVISSPLVVRGEARGNWFFEASFPIELYDANDNRLASGIAQADGEWMTTDFVGFTSNNLTFTAPTNVETGYLLLKKDNPSGMPENDDEVRIPVRFR